MSAEPFGSRFRRLVAKRGRLCVGIDPSSQQLAAWRLSDDVASLRKYCESVVDAAGELATVFKPQSAFFERHGPDGIRELQRTIAMAKEAGALVILDAKRGDIASSATAYGEAYLGRSSFFKADAITVHAYLGLDALNPVFDIAHNRGASVFVVVRSSNPEGAIIQSALIADGKTVAEHLADRITAYNEKFADEYPGPIGAVIGATILDEAYFYADKLRRSLILAPGIGAQGATLDGVQQIFGEHWTRLIPSISRDIASAGPDLAALRAQVRLYTSKTM